MRAPRSDRLLGAGSPLAGFTRIPHGAAMCRRPALAALALGMLLASSALAAETAPPTTRLELPAPTVVHALAVADTPNGAVGSVSTISITAARNGTGLVFVDTAPLAQVDMQGSARLAVRVAAAVTGNALHDYDFFFVVRSEASVIGGPSAGGVMTVGAIAAMQGWAINQSVMMTGTINPDGDIGPIGGLAEKIQAAAHAGATLFLYPEGQDNVSRLGSTSSARGQIVHIPDECAALAIQCRPIGQVEDAVLRMTGHAFQATAATGNVTSATFIAAMKPLASNLTSDARALVANASSHLDRSARSLPPNVRAGLQTTRGGATSALTQAEDAFQNGRYYTASSFSYRASVNARIVEYTIGLYETPDPNAYVQGLVADAETRAATAIRASRVQVLGVPNLEGIGAAQQRASEAESDARSARATYAQGDAANTVQWAAQARERSTSVGWWLQIAQQARDPAHPLSDDALNRTASDLVDIAQETLVYAQTILQEAGGDASGLTGPNSANDLLNRAQADLQRGLLPAATFEAIESEVRSSASLELLGTDTASVADAKLARARDRAAEAISEAREEGVEPLLAQSYFEFAGDQTEAKDALPFYNTARSIALIGHQFFASDAPPRRSHFVGFDPVPSSPPSIGLLGSSASATLLGATLVLGLAVGVIGGTALGAALRRKPAQASPLPAESPLPAPPEPTGMDPFLEYASPRPNDAPSTKPARTQPAPAEPSPEEAGAPPPPAGQPVDEAR